jgi:hypothetical protein
MRHDSIYISSGTEAMPLFCQKHTQKKATDANQIGGPRFLGLKYTERELQECLNQAVNSDKYSIEGIHTDVFIR